MKTIAVLNMKRSDKLVYRVFEPGQQLTREQIAAATEYSLVSITRILSRLQSERHIRAIRQGRKTVYERVS